MMDGRKKVMVMNVSRGWSLAGGAGRGKPSVEERCRKEGREGERGGVGKLLVMNFQ